MIIPQKVLVEREAAKRKATLVVDVELDSESEVFIIYH